MTVFLQFAHNILVLTFIGIAYFLIESRREALGKHKADVLKGLCFGLTAALATVTPLTLSDGATVDARAGPVMLAGIVAGPLGGVLAAFFGGMARGYVGGAFALSGMVVYLVYALLGVGLRYARIVTPSTLFSYRSIGILVTASLVGASAMFFLIQPMSRAIQWFFNDLPLVLLANTLSVTYASLVLGIAILYLERSAELLRINETLTLARRAGRFGIWDYDIRNDKLIWDQRSKELHGIDSASFLGSFEDWEKKVHPDDLQKTKDMFYRALRGEGTYDAEYRVKLPNGGQRSIKGDATIVRDRTGHAVRVVGTNIDVTAIREADAKLNEARSLALQAQRAETISQLTGGVAHDFNNLLAVIVGSLELLKKDIDRHDSFRTEAHALIDACLEASRRGSQLTRNMLAYARKADLAPETINLNDVVRETAEWLRRTIERNIEIKTVLQPELWPTFMDKTLVQSALVNLLVNARDAIEGSGTVTIETRNIYVNAQRGFSSDARLPLGRYVMLMVADTGIGMTEEVRERIFDPFFTTKPPGRGTGLGLSMVHGFVTQSRGTIDVQSEPGKGTRFRLVFPASEAPRNTKSGAVRDERLSNKTEHVGRIMLVEDQPAVMNVQAKILRAAGFDVVTASSGDEAYALFQNDQRFDLVLTDIVMPGELQGPTLAIAIRKQDPDMRFLFLSGYVPDENSASDGIGSNDIRLLKPVGRAELLESIEKRLSIPP